MTAGAATLNGAAPALIAHRGASGERPEHTLAAYDLAIAQGADYIEPDLVLTRDGILIARHENEIGDTTDVAAHPAFHARRRVQRVDGVLREGWFTEDFTLAELGTLRARERLPDLRPANATYDGHFVIPTFDAIIALASQRAAELGRPIGIYPETKHPSHFAAIGLPHAPPLLAALAAARLPSPAVPVVIQSFEMGNLSALRDQTRATLIQLIAADSPPFDRPDTALGWMTGVAGLAAIARYADGIGPDKQLVIARTAGDRLGEDTGLVTRAHAAGLLVHPWTFRRENIFLPAGFRAGKEPGAPGALAQEIEAFLNIGIDGLFTDNPREARAAIDACVTALAGTGAAR